MAHSEYVLRLKKPAHWLSSILVSSLLAAPLQASELQLGIHQVGNWHAADDSLLVIEDHQRQQYHAQLKAPCQGLSEAKSIAFISNGKNALDQFSKVILPNGKRCSFKSFSVKSVAIGDDDQP